MFAVIGEALIDLVQPGFGASYEARPGGGPLNIAVGLQRLGHPTTMMARLSDTPLGRLVRAYAASNELDLSACVTTPENPTLAFASVDEHGVAGYDFYLEGTGDWGWNAAELERLPKDARVVHTGSLACAIPPGAEQLLAWWRRLDLEGDRLLTFDPNIRPIQLSHPNPAALVESFVAASQLVKISDEDLTLLYPGDSPHDVARRWLGLGPELMVMTQGANGCRALRPDGRILDVPAPQVSVIDTIGAGDAFMSGLLSGLADIGAATPGGLRTLPTEDLQVALERAVTVAALTCTRPSADPPTRRELDRAIVGSPTRRRDGLEAPQ
ncbi:MAG: carbohydrate kinase family protein [Nocardioidaceae bacterium]